MGRINKRLSSWIAVQALLALCKASAGPFAFPLPSLTSDLLVWGISERSCLHTCWFHPWDPFSSLFLFNVGNLTFPFCCGCVPVCLIHESVSFWRPGLSTERAVNDFTVACRLLAHQWFSDTPLFRENFMYELFWTGILGEEEGKILAISHAFCWDLVFVFSVDQNNNFGIALSALWVGAGGRVCVVKGRKERKKPKKSHLPVCQLLSCDDRAQREDTSFLSCHVLTCKRLLEDPCLFEINVDTEAPVALPRRGLETMKCCLNGPPSRHASRSQWVALIFGRG